ncbi:Mycolic acid cyclopropane synthetase-domain-containing protein [Armillaria nabsnona]|nr:Mycolic acid cyclopropane synthetase-domain-containing protein [Armillaria nabsnona]
MEDIPSISLSETQVLGAKYAPSLGRAIERIWFSLTESISSLTWGPFLAFCKSQVLGALSGISTGHLTIIDGEDVYEFGADEEPRALLRIRSDEFWTRVALFTDLGLAESFMSSIVDCDDVSTLIKLMIVNRDHLLRSLNSFASSLFARGRLLTSYNLIGTFANSRANVSAHYDIGDELFHAFLSPDMNYSSAIFSKLDADLTGVPEDTLEDGQMRKMKMILQKADIQPGDRVLEIGTGWGALAILAASTIPGCKVDTVTLSSNQSAFARKRINEAGLSDSIVVHEMDFRECLLKPEWAGAFDRFISVEMIEQVGKAFLTEYWKVVDWAMKPNTGVGVVQSTTFPEAQAETYNSDGAGFMDKWVRSFIILVYLSDLFPGGYLPTPCILMETMKMGSSGRLTVDSMANIGPHFARTLREWKRNFVDSWEETIAPALVRKYNLTVAEQEVFRRKWICSALSFCYMLWA